MGTKLYQLHIAKCIFKNVTSSYILVMRFNDYIINNKND